MSALDIARAALREVGRHPSSVSETRATSGREVSLGSAPGDVVAGKAALLALQATYGPDYTVRCWRCHETIEFRSRCSRVVDVLAGKNCARWS